MPPDIDESLFVTCYLPTERFEFVSAGSTLFVCLDSSDIGIWVSPVFIVVS
jgi:hypothetical protein